eukprot:12370788-Prorocentrum_lima.AAC.1
MCSTHRRNFPQRTDARGTYHAPGWTYGRTCILPINRVHRQTRHHLRTHEDGNPRTYRRTQRAL